MQSMTFISWRMKEHMYNHLIRAVSKSSFNRKDVYHPDIFKTSIFHGVSKLNISQWWTFFPMKYDFHSSRMKGRISDDLIREVWKSYFNWKHIFHCEIFEMPIFHDAPKLNISQWRTFFLTMYGFHTSRIKGHISNTFIREV